MTPDPASMRYPYGSNMEAAARLLLFWLQRQRPCGGKRVPHCGVL